MKIQPDERCPCESGSLYRNCHSSQVKSTTPVITEHRHLIVIREPDPGTRTVFVQPDGSGGTIFFQGTDSGVSYDYGSCDTPLVQGLADDAISGIVMQCNRCGAFNEFGEGDSLGLSSRQFDDP